MSQCKRIAYQLTLGWFSEADLWELLGIRNGWGRTSELNAKGLDIKSKWVNDSKGKKSHMVKHVTKKEYNRVFGK